MWPFKQKETRSAYTLPELEALLGTANSRSGVAVDSSTAQALTAVFSAVSFISKGVAGYPLSASTNALDDVLNQSPDGVMTAYHWRSAVMQNLLLTGNAYSRLRWKRTGQLDKVEFLHSSRVSTVIEPPHKLKGYLVDGKPVGRSNMLHFKINAYDGLVGKSPIGVCRESVGLGLAQQNQAADQVKNGLRPNGIIEFPAALGATAGQKFRESLSKRTSGDTLILEGGGSWKSIALSNVDAEFLESRRFSVDEVARMFNLDKIWLQNSQHGARYDELGASQKSLLTNTLQPYMIELESELSLKLGQPIAFNLSEIQRLDVKTRYEAYKAAIDAQILSPEEVRQREGFK
ncbi:phage portal protein [Neiella sp. HB171785]|uniref:Phage portal protein n=1 Tax=Neiella litorisoli TaxID=2771431 RepID=A0A8J6QHD1_9GAMM|nr:phage portal protein [Neiella litorisoli]MBD1388433.1 phage portal protein [Neiella litorisoli]